MIDAPMPMLMAILNVTPDSFSDGGLFRDVESAVAHATRLLDEGAAIVDVGGESTRPEAQPVPADEQIRRVAPVIERLAPIVAGRRTAVAGHDPCDRPCAGPGCAPCAPWSAAALPTISIDTASAKVAADALDAGATIVNDVSAGRDDPAMLGLVATRRAGVVLMHRLVPPAHDSYSDRYESPPLYEDVVADVAAFLGERVAAALAAGIDRDAIAIDPGLGFGKGVEQNYELLRRIGELRRAHPRVLAGASRKSFLAAADRGAPHSTPADRLGGSLAAAIIAAERGADVLRVHDVAATRQALAVTRAAQRGRPLRSPAG